MKIEFLSGNEMTEKECLKLVRNISITLPPPQAAGKERKRLPMNQRAARNKTILEPVGGLERVYQRLHFDETCWAYMKLLRENNKTKKVFDIDPYVEVYQFRENVYGLLAASLDGGADVWMYLVIGQEKAMLVDAAWGLGNLKGLVDEITGGMPLIVVNTHCHFDHAYGNCQFDTVYCHEFEAPSLIAQNEHMWDYLFEEDTGECIWDKFKREDLIPFKDYMVVACPDGYTFDLGKDHEIELFFLGGHSAGHCGYLDKKNRIFFCGDDFISMRVSIGGPKPGVCFGEYATVNAIYDRVAVLAERTNEFDSLFPGHFVVDIESSVVHNMLAACKDILEAPEKNNTAKMQGKNGSVYLKNVEGLGTIQYTSNSILRPEQYLK